MHQDGSGEKPDPSPQLDRPGLSNTDGPRRMLLTLINEWGGENEKQLAPFARSYKEAVQLAMIAFHERLPDGVDAEDIILKSNLKNSDASPAWAGLVTARESEEIWRWIVSTGSLTPEIGVFVITRYDETTDSFKHDETMPKVYLNRSTSETQWVQVGYYIPAPATYKEFSRQVYLDLRRNGNPPPPPNLSPHDFHKRIQLKVLDESTREWHNLIPSEYRSTLVRYASRHDNIVNTLVSSL